MYIYRDYGVPLNDVWLLHMPLKEEEEIFKGVGKGWRWEKFQCSGPPPCARTSHASVIHGNVMVVSGGQSHLNGTTVLSDTYQLDLETRYVTSAYTYTNLCVLMNIFI
jgi:hypothetical protein